MIQIRHLLGAAVLTSAIATPAVGAPPLADVHLHYSWNQSETIEPEAAVALLDRHDIVLAVVSSTPTERALRLKAADPKGRVRVLFSPYLTPPLRHTWFAHPEVLERAERALASGEYVGIGEVHMVAGMPPPRSNTVFRGLIELALKYDRPMLLHAEASDYRYLLPVCREFPELRVLWAHAGGKVPPQQVGRLLEACSNVSVDLSARDPWRYVRNPITDEQGTLLPAWRKLLLRWPDRFMVGADALWPVDQLHGWEQADTGWDRLGEFVGFHRRWMSGLPSAVEQRVRLDNALRFFRMETADTGSRRATAPQSR